MDLRARLATVVGATVAGARGDGRGRDALARYRSPSLPYRVTEEHVAIDDLGLAVIGRGPPDAGLLAHLGLRGDAPTSWSQILFLDTETSGLAGGAGTYVFLLGTLEVGDGEVILRQHALSDLGAEAAFVAAMRAELDRFRACATYNGKCFDIPLLRDRVSLHFPTALEVDRAHLDLVHPARRWWRERAGSARLRDLEDAVLADPREDDLPGDLIPRTYFTFLTTQDESLLRRVAAHNRRDLLALLRLADRMCRVVVDARSGRTPLDPREALGLAIVFDRVGENDSAASCYAAAFHDGGTRVRRSAALPYAASLERAGEVGRAVEALEVALALDGAAPPGWRQRVESRLRRLARLRLRVESHSRSGSRGSPRARRSAASRNAMSTASTGVFA